MRISRENTRSRISIRKKFNKYCDAFYGQQSCYIQSDLKTDVEKIELGYKYQKEAIKIYNELLTLIAEHNDIFEEYVVYDVEKRAIKFFKENTLQDKEKRV